MSPRAAWRLEQLGFADVYDYVPGKTDWFANGMPREGKAAETLWAGDLARGDASTCAVDEEISVVRARVLAAKQDFCVVVNGERIVLGRLRGDALSTAGATAGDVMELGPRTIRPHNPVEKLLQSRSNERVTSWIVSTSHGRLLGVLLRADVEHARAAMEGP